MNGESLIPKKAVSRPTYNIPGGAGAFFRLSFIFFLSVGILSGGLLFYRNQVSNSLEEDKSILKKIETEFEPALLSEINLVSSSLSNGKNILDKHLKQSDIFFLLEENTLPQVFYNSFTYSHNQKSLVLLGESINYSTIASQSKVFESLEKIESVIFSNLTLRDTGRVAFTLTLNFK
jgi:hypothetical protein